MEDTDLMPSISQLHFAFDTSTRWFESIQFGHHFGEDFEIYMIRLEVAYVRRATLFGLIEATSDAKSLTKLKSHTPETIDDARQKFEWKAENSELTLVDLDEDLQPGFKELQKHFLEIRRPRYEVLPPQNFTEWVLYEREACIGLISDIRNDLDDLENLVNNYAITSGSRMELAKQEVANIDSGDLAVLTRVIENDDDEVLSEAASQAIEDRGDVHYFEGVVLEDYARSKFGDYVGRGERGRCQHVINVKAGGRSRSHFGNTHEGFTGNTVFGSGDREDELKESGEDK